MKEIKVCVKDTCKRCDIGYLVKDYLLPLMQAMTYQLTEYNMRLIDTKCLNTSVLFFNLFFGKKALKHTMHCDVHNVVSRHDDNIDNSVVIAQQLGKDILRKTKSRYVYYIMLTDGYFIKPDGSRVFFPGHVFVLEKIPWGDDHFYYMYQSYINQYNFATYANKHNSIKVHRSSVKYYMDEIMRMVTQRVWDAAFVRFWNDMTRVDTSHMLGGVPERAFYVCYRKVQHNSCVKNVRTFVKQTLRSIPRNAPDAIYGESATYDENSHPLTNREMHEQLSKLLARMENNVRQNI
jgi:hypothetical protein